MKELDLLYWTSFFNMCDALREGKDTFECASGDAYVWCFAGNLVYDFFPAAKKYVKYIGLYDGYAEFCGLTEDDIDLKNNVIDINHQLHRLSDMTMMINPTKTNAGTRKIPITDDVADMFRAIIEDREVPLFEKGVDGYKRFLYYDKNGLPLVSLHWEHRIQRMKGRYNELYKLQIDFQVLDQVRIIRNAIVHANGKMSEEWDKINLIIRPADDVIFVDDELLLKTELILSSISYNLYRLVNSSLSKRL